MPYQSYPKSTTAYAASLVIKKGPGVLLSVFGYNSGSAQWVQIHDAAALPAEDAVPIHTFKVAATDNFSMIIPNTGLPCGTGIVVCNSSTGPTKTIGAADCWFTTTVQA